MSKDHLNLSFTFLISKYYNMNSILQELCTYINGARNRTKTQALKKKTIRLHATLNMNRTRYLCPHNYRNANVVLEGCFYQLGQLGDAWVHVRTHMVGTEDFKTSLTILV